MSFKNEKKHLCCQGGNMCGNLGTTKCLFTMAVLKGYKIDENTPELFEDIEEVECGENGKYYITKCRLYDIATIENTVNQIKKGMDKRSSEDIYAGYCRNNALGKVPTKTKERLVRCHGRF